MAALLVVSCGLMSTGDEASPPDKLVLIHGFGDSNFATALLAERLTEAGYDVFRVGYRSWWRTPEEILLVIREQIDRCCADREDTVHFVGHSLGGLLIRAYLADKAPPGDGRVVVMGSPNRGTPVVDEFRERWWMQLVGPVARALGTDEGSFGRRLPTPSYPLGVIAGDVEQRRFSDLIPGPDDGVVPVSSTRVEGMSDFIVLPIIHSMLPNDPEVARQIVAFLDMGQFDHGGEELPDDALRNVKAGTQSSSAPQHAQPAL